VVGNGFAKRPEVGGGVVGGVGREESRPSGEGCEDDEIVMRAGALGGVDDKSLGCGCYQRLKMRGGFAVCTFCGVELIVAPVGDKTDD
jgi:hypothetical protein